MCSSPQGSGAARRGCSDCGGTGPRAASRACRRCISSTIKSKREATLRIGSLREEAVVAMIVEVEMMMRRMMMRKRTIDNSCLAHILCVCVCETFTPPSCECHTY